MRRVGVTRRLFGTLCGLVFLVNFGRVVFAPLLETLMGAFGVGAGTGGFIATLAWLGTALPRIPMGYVLMSVPRHRVVLTTGVVLAGAATLTALAPTVPVLALGALCLGVASGAYFVAAVPMVSALYPDRVGQAIGVHGTASQVAAVLAPGVVTAVLVVTSWRAVFVFLAIAALLVTALLTRAVRANPVAVEQPPKRDFSAVIRTNWRLLLAGVVMVGAAGFVWQGLFNFYITYLTQAKGLSSATAQTLLSLVFAAGVPAFWYSGRLADRLPHVPYVLAILAAFAGCLLALTVVRSLALLVVVTVLLGYAIHSLFPALDTYILGALPVETGASGYAVYSGVALLVEANGSGVVGALTGAGYGFESVFRTFAVGLLVVLVALCGLYRAGRLPGTAVAR